MRVLVFVTLATWAVQALQLTSPSSELKLIPNIAQNISPFELKAESFDEPITRSYHVAVQCSESVRTSLVFSPMADFCKSLQLKGTIAEINGYLQSLKVQGQTLIGSNSEPRLISYTVWPDEDPTDVMLFSQYVSFESEMPIQMLKDMVIYHHERSSKIFEHILQLDPRFMNNEGTRVEVWAEGEAFPAWLKYKFVGAELVLSGKPPRSEKGTVTISLTLFDPVSGLKSPKVTINVMFLSGNQSGPLLISFVVFFLSMSISLVIIVAVYILRGERTTSEDQNAPAEPREQVIYPKVLSESITNWNNTTQPKRLNNIRPLTSPRQQSKATFNDSMYDLEALKNDLRVECGTEARSLQDKSFMREESPFKVVQFDDISDISAENESKTLSAPTKGQKRRQ